MKKLLLLLLFIPLFLNSCSDDDNKNYDLAGTWVFESYTAKEIKTNNSNATQAIKKKIAETTDSCIYVFLPDGTFTFIDEDDISSGTYELKGNTLTIKEENKKSVSIKINLNENTFSSDRDETEKYQNMIKYLVPNEKDVIISKVITKYTYKRK